MTHDDIVPEMKSPQSEHYSLRVVRDGNASTDVSVAAVTGTRMGCRGGGTGLPSLAPWDSPFAFVLTAQ